MSLPLEFTTHPLTHAVGLALVHGIWQGAAIALVVGGLWWWIPPARSRARHGLALGALVLQAALLPVTTAAVLVRDPGPASCACGEAAGAPAGTVESADSGSLAGRLDAAYLGARPLLPWLVLAWLAGASLGGARLGIGVAAVERLRRRSRPAPTELAERTRRLARRAGLRASFEVRVSDEIEVPAAVGWAPPAILVPARELRRERASDLDALVLHEAAHLAGRDPALVVVQAILRSLLFHHPAAGWICRRLAEAREHRCDDVAAGHAGRATYLRALADLESRRGGPLPAALHASDGSLLERVRRLAEPSRRPSARRLASGAVLALSSIAAAFWLQLAVLPEVMAFPPGWTTIQARDGAGAFTVTLAGGRVAGATIEGESLPPDRLAERGDSLHFLDAAGVSRFAVHVEREGGLQWTSRPAEWRLEPRPR